MLHIESTVEEIKQRKSLPTGRDSWKSTKHEFAYISGRVYCLTRYFQGRGDGEFRDRSSLFPFIIGMYSLVSAVFPHLFPALPLCSPFAFLAFFVQVFRWNWPRPLFLQGPGKPFPSSQQIYSCSSKICPYWRGFVTNWIRPCIFVQPDVILYYKWNALFLWPS